MAVLKAFGAYLPARVVPNQELGARLQSDTGLDSGCLRNRRAPLCAGRRVCCGHGCCGRARMFGSRRDDGCRYRNVPGIVRFGRAPFSRPGRNGREQVRCHQRTGARYSDGQRRRIGGDGARGANGRGARQCPGGGIRKNVYGGIARADGARRRNPVWRWRGRLRHCTGRRSGRISSILFCTPTARTRKTCGWNLKLPLR